MGGNSFWGLIAGVVVGAVVAVFTGGVGLLALAAFSITSAAVSYALAPDAPKIDTGKGAVNKPTGGADSSELQFPTSSEAKTIPVGFGRFKIAGNFLHYDSDTFKAKKIYRYVATSGTIESDPDGTEDILGPDYTFDEDEYAESGSAAEDKGVKFRRDVIGYRYYISFDYGLCMGPVDRCVQIYSSPGDFKIAAGAQVLDSNSHNFDVEGVEEGGRIRIYRGTSDQTRASTDAYSGSETNGRFVCWAHFKKFLIGTSPNVRSYLFELERRCVCLNAGGTPVSGLIEEGSVAKTITQASASSTKLTFVTSTDHKFRKGDHVNVSGVVPDAYNGRWKISTITGTDRFTVSNTSDPANGTDFGTVFHDSYKDANPAAILWEVLTDKIWGRGLDPDDLDEDSFVEASEHFAANHIGMSLVLDQQGILEEAIAAIREHTGSIIFNDGEKIRIKVFGDTAVPPKAIINEEDVSDVQFNRPAWANTPNEIRAEFNDRYNNYTTGIVHEIDQAAVQTTGRINSKKIALNGFSSRGVAERETRRILNGLSFPKATLQFKTNRFESRLLPGDLIEFVWNEWTGGEAHTFFRIAAITDDNQDENGISITCQEDQYATAYIGDQETYTTPVPGHLAGEIRDPAELDLNSDALESPDLDASTLNHISIVEADIVATGGATAVFVFAEPSLAGLLGIRLSWKLPTETEYRAVEDLEPFCFTGALTEALPVESSDLNRSADGLIKFTLVDESYETNATQLFNRVTDDDDDLSTLTTGGLQMAVINGEFFYIGQIVDSGTTDGGNKVFHASNYLRAQRGSSQSSHSISDTIILLPVFFAAPFYYETSNIPSNTTINWRATPYNIRGFSAVPFDFDYTITDLGKKPLSPSGYSATDASGTWTLRIRPRFHTAGAGIFSDLQSEHDTLITEIPPGYSFWAQAWDGGLSNGTLFQITDGTFTPDDGESHDAGLFSFDYTVPANTDEIRIWTALDGHLSTDYASLAP